MKLRVVQPAAEYLIAVDAGLDGLGISAWDLRVKTLLEATYLPTPHRNLNQTRADVEHWLDDRMELLGRKRTRCVIEQMKVRKQGDAKAGDPKYLIKIANVIGAVGSLFPVLDLPEPFEWKGSMPKPVTRNNLMRDLDPEEKRNFRYPPQKGLRHNVDDAAYLGLRAMFALRLRKPKLERFKPGHPADRSRLFEVT